MNFLVLALTHARIAPLFEELLSMRVGIYASNQRVKTNKLVKLGQEDAQEEPLPQMPSESDLTEFESAVEIPRSHVISLKFHNEDNKLKLQNILASVA